VVFLFFWVMAGWELLLEGRLHYFPFPVGRRSTTNVFHLRVIKTKSPLNNGRRAAFAAAGKWVCTMAKSP